MSHIVTRPQSPFRRLAAGFGALAAAALAVGAMIAVVGLFYGSAPTPADVLGPPVRAQTNAGDRVFLLTSQWKTYRPRYSRYGGSRPAYTALLVDVWAFDAASGEPVWRRRMEKQREGVNAGRVLLGAERGVLWLQSPAGLQGLSPADSRTLVDLKAIEARNPQLAGLMPRHEGLFRFDDAGLAFRANDGRDWRLDAATLVATPGKAPPADGTKAFAPARLSGGVSTWAFHERGLHLTGRWIGMMSDGEAERSQAGRTLAFDPPDEAPRVRLWGAKSRQEAGFVGVRTLVGEIEPYPESPEFLRGGLLSDGNLKNQPLLLFDPDSLLVLHWDRLGDGGRLQLTRVGPKGRPLWTASLPMARLDAVMPGETTLALMGSQPERDLARPRERLPVEVDQLAVVDLKSGQVTTFGFRFKPPERGGIPTPVSEPPAPK
jgi:hypothetical protein